MFGKREAILAVLLGLVLYGFIFYKVIWSNTVPEIQAANTKLESVTKQKEALDRDLANIANKKIELNAKNVNNERLEEYLMKSADITDAVDFLDKLSKLLDKDLTNIGASGPNEQTAEGERKYYRYDMNFATKLNFAQVQNLIHYIEGGSKKLKISNFKMDPVTTGKNGTSPTPKPTQSKQTQSPTQQQTLAANKSDLEYTISMTVHMYSLNAGNLDKINEYSRHKFDRFMDGNGIVFGTDSLQSSAETSKPVVNTVASLPGKDIEFRMDSFLAAGPNFRIYGVDRRDEVIELKTKSKQVVNCVFNEGSYNIKTVDDTGRIYAFNGPIHLSSIGLYVNVNFPVIEENNKLGLDIKIANYSSKKITVSLDNKSKRANIMDRQGNIIYKSSESEKVYIL